MNKNNYISHVPAYCMLIVHARFSFLLKIFFLLFLFFAFAEPGLKAADRCIGEEEITPFMYDEIPVRVIVEGYNNFYVDAIYTKNKLLYVNIEDLFKTLNIPCVVGQNGNSISGFVEEESHAYLIDYTAGQIKSGDKIINSRAGLVKEMGALYMESSLLADVFGLKLTFNFRSLSMQLKSDFELPVIKQQRIEKMRSNVSKLKGEEMADTVLQRNYHLFKFGTLDWSVASSQSWKAATNSGFNTPESPVVSAPAWQETTNNHFGLSLGTELLYGEADISVNYYDRQKFDHRQLQYLWRWVDNDKRIIKQAQVGKISNQSISFLNAPVIGAVIRNSPTTLRKAKGYYTINEFTEPNWTVELYINNVMVDYTKADASGLFMFKVPNVYGYTTLKLKFYGPLGEERTDERSMNMPYTVMPVNEFEYGLSGGIVQDSSSSRFGRGEFNYGVNRFLTVGGGLEYLSSIPNAPFIPFATATLQPFSKLTFNGEYAHGVKARGLLNYYIRRDILLEIDYARYKEGQLATRFNAPEERKIKLSVPVKYKKINGFVKFDYTQLLYKAFSYNQAGVMFSAYYRQISANSSTQLNWIGQKPAYITSELALSYRLKKGYSIRPSARYDVSKNTFMSYKVAVEKSIPRGNISVAYEKNMAYHDDYVSLNFKYDLSFARTNMSASHSKGSVNISENAQGSLAFGSGNKYVHVSNNASVSKGGISIYPFLDLNQNGTFDAGEHMLKLNTVSIMGGKVIFSEKDSIVRIADLTAFTNYVVEFKDNDLENIAWRFKNKRFQVLVDPNQFKRIDVPVVPVGEISGMAYKDNDNSLKGIGRILVKFYRKNGLKPVAEILSESDGYIYYLGLEPGEYVARVDSVQLSNLGFIAEPPQKDFTIKRLREGDMVGGLDFVLHTETKDSLGMQDIKSESEMGVMSDEEKKLQAVHRVILIAQKKAAPLDMQENTQPEPMPHLPEQVRIVKDSVAYIPGDTLFKVQLLALRKPIRNTEYFKQIMADVPGLTIIETYGEDGLYHYSTQAFRGIAEGMAFRQVIQKSGWKDSFVAIYAGEQRAEMTFRLKRGKSPALPVKNVPARLILPGGQKKMVLQTTTTLVNEQNVRRAGGNEIAESDKVIHPGQRTGVVIDTLACTAADTLYKVQLLTLRVPIRVKGYFVRLLTAVEGLTIEEALGEDGLYHYSTGAFRGIAESMEFLRIIRGSGWKDCFIAVYAGRKSGETTYRLKRTKSGSHVNRQTIRSGTKSRY